MKKLLSSVALAVALLSGCVSLPPSQPPPRSSEATWIAPEQAVLMAAKAAPAGVPGVFALGVQATGTQGNRTYLNSETDYRDQRNLTIALTARAAKELADRLGADPLVALKGRNILVQGSAVRTKIYFIANGRMTEKYYYQTHVNVTEAAQIAVR